MSFAFDITLGWNVALLLNNGSSKFWIYHNKLYILMGSTINYKMKSILYLYVDKGNV
jgi:hypothetical protein